jgi:hypothetical protein
MHWPAKINQKNYRKKYDNAFGPQRAILLINDKSIRIGTTYLKCRRFGKEKQAGGSVSV